MQRLLLPGFLFLILGAGFLAADLPQPAGDPDFDPQADAAADVRRASEQATREGKHILLDVGGEWCVWCHKMGAFFVEHPELLKIRQDNYVLVKINMSEENENKTFLSQFPDIEGYPHIFILDASGKLLRSQNTGALEDGKSYDLAVFTRFLEQWAPKR
jgi:thioredoxin-related protein